MKCIVLVLLFIVIKRSRGTFKNELETIKGIGEQTATQLLKEFKSVKKIKEKNYGRIGEADWKSQSEIAYGIISIML